MNPTSIDEVYTGSKVELGWQITVMALNFLGPMVAAATSAIVMFASGILPRNNEQYASSAGETSTPISAASWAFSIWGVIYPGLISFVIYQVLPSEWVPQRSDEMIYYSLNLIPVMNFIANASWFPFAFEESQWSLILSTLVIWFMLATGLASMIIADQSEVWWPEVLFIRLPWSIYTGWLIAATLLSTSSMLKSWGMRDKQTDEWWLANPNAWTFLQDLMFITEEDWAIILVWAAEILVELIAWGDRNPVFGAVFLWAGSGVISETVTERPDKQNFLINISTIVGVHSISMITLVAYLIFETFQPWYEPLSFWAGGTIGKTNWAQMFTDFNWLFTIMENYISGAVGGRQDVA